MSTSAVAYVAWLAVPPQPAGGTAGNPAKRRNFRPELRGPKTPVLGTRIPFFMPY
jgi:hypothetical protein